MEIKDVATEMGSRAFICYNTTLITLIPSRSMEKYTTRVEIEASWPAKSIVTTTREKFHIFRKKAPMALQLLHRTVVNVAHNSPCEGDGLHCIWKSTAVDISKLLIGTSNFWHFFGATLMYVTRAILVG